MISFLSATPGSGKSLLATDLLYKLSKENIKNLNHNYFYAKAFFEKIEQLQLSNFLRSVTVTSGQGLDRPTEYLFLENDFFDFLKTKYHINMVISEYSDLEMNFPEFYYERVSTLNLIIDYLNENEKTSFDYFKPVRTIYTNIADLRLSQARSLPLNCDWRLTPQGSYFVIDEAQLIPIFSEEAKQIDPIVKELTIHRHKGYDFLFITQDPSFVNKYIRKLASLHTHLINIFGWEQSMKIEWTVVQENPNAVRSLSRSENITRWKFPKYVYSLYKSSTIHTRKKRIPKKLVILVVLACLFFLSAALLFSKDSAVVRFIKGESPIDLKVENKNETNKRATDGNRLDSSKAFSNETATSEATQKKEQVLSDEDSDSDISVSSDSLKSQPVYDPSKPYDFKPVSSPTVVNHRVFSGCAKWKGIYYAYDQQGTYLKTFSESDCKEIIKNSSNRPFDYFKQQQPQQQPQFNNDINTEESNKTSSKYTVIDGVVYLLEEKPIEITGVNVKQAHDLSFNR